jgi:hypothetical protein
LTAPEALLLVSLSDLAGQRLNRREGDWVFMERGLDWQPRETVEAQLTKHCQAQGLDSSRTDVWLANMMRLGLLEVDRDIDYDLVHLERERINATLRRDDFRALYITAFGRGFLAACRPLNSASM